MNYRSWARCIIPLQAILGMFVISLGASSSIATNSTNPVQRARELKPTSKHDCWVFSHMNKSGGMTVRKMIMPFLKEKGVSTGLFDDIEWSSGRSYAENFVKENAVFTYGGYTEGLRMYDDRDCKWFTVFRHPVSRVVSAYFYCQRAPHDQLCAAVVLDASKVDLLTFAEHWGNYGLRQFALASIKAEDVFHDKVVSEFCQQARGHGDVCIPAWYRQKHYLHLPHQDDFCGPTQPESGLAQFLSSAQETLSTRYAAVGIIEEWDNSMELFNRVLNLRRFDWVKEFQKSGKRNSGGSQFETASERALKAAWHSPELKKFIWLDILLYDHALSVHRSQVADLGIV